jgi:23S rRNA pseudouridine2457 synthase
MSGIVLFNKPFAVLSQFTPEAGRASLSEFLLPPDVYPAGRLDADSEGLLVLTCDGRLQQRIADPRHKLEKVYWAQVEGVPDATALAQLGAGVRLREYTTQPARVRLADDPPWLWPRTPPIRFRRHIPTAWLELVLTEGRNRQVRRMTAAVGYPTLRLVRYAVGEWTLAGLAPGKWRVIEAVPGGLTSVKAGRKRVNLFINPTLNAGQSPHLYTKGNKR